MSLLELDNIYFSADGNQVLDNVSLKIEKGTVTGFLGSPGSGKSTALKTIAGIIIPSHGKVLFEDKDIFTMTRKEILEFRRRCGFMFQDSALWANQDIYHNFLLPLQIHFPKMNDAERREKIQQICERVGYNRDLKIRPAALSIGEQKRVGFGRALICNPDVLFLDEPTESLDVKSSDIITSILKDFVQEGKTVVFVSHDTAFVNAFKSDKYYFDKGTIVDKILQNDDLIWDDEDL